MNITKIADDLCPIKSYKVRDNKPVWLTNELVELQKDRDYFYSKAKQTRDPGDWFIAQNMRNIANNAVNNVKARYIKHKIENNKENPKRFWRLIASLIIPNNR